MANGVITDALLKSHPVPHPSLQGTTVNYNLAEELEIAYHNNRPYILGGHSLGGFLAAEAIRHLPKFIHKVYSFNSPWMCRSQGKDWKKKVESGVASNDKVVQWIMDGDLVPGIGQRPIGKCLAVSPKGDPLFPPVFSSTNPVYMHQQHMLSRGNFYVQEVHIKLERKKRSRKIGDGVRVMTGYVHRFRQRLVSQGAR